MRGGVSPRGRAGEVDDWGEGGGGGGGGRGVGDSGEMGVYWRRRGEGVEGRDVMFVEDGCPLVSIFEW